ncbi:hypothetical protein FOZ60_002897 [Perkinsus olseni]|uniref:Uncharacterized protein n=1 Tax=Perkinsus olseni TaxID=32597 RepID=A0A7J6NXR9_PEROL|nr:hypothetical protein FOZ60_002897 [Perkinsus olseni]
MWPLLLNAEEFQGNERGVAVNAGSYLPRVRHSNDRGGQDDHKALTFKVGLWSVPQMTNIICPKTGAKGKFKIRFDKTGLNPIRRLDKSTFREELARLNSAAIKLNYRRESDTEVRALDKNIEQMGPAGKETVARMRDVCWAAIRVIEKSYPTHDSLCNKYGKGM